MISGIVETTETVGKEAAVAEAQKEEAETLTLARDDASARIRAFLYPGGTYNDQRAEQLRNLLTARGVDPDLLWMVWETDKMKSERLRLVEDAEKKHLPI